MRKILVFFTAFFLSLAGARSLFAASDYGTTAANFLKIPVAPVPAGMGQAYTAMYGTDSVLYNPGALAIMNYSSISGAHEQYILDMTHEYLAANFRFKFGTVAFSYNSFSSGKFQGYDDDGGIERPSDKISADFNSMALTFAKSWPYFPEDKGMLDPMPLTPFWTRMEPVEEFRSKTSRFSVGATVKRISENLQETSASTFAFDAGAMLILPGHWQFGASFLNNGGKIKHYSKAASLPSQMRLGVAKDFHSKNDMMIFTFDVDGIKDYDSDYYMAAGTEVNIAKVFQVRAGYNTKQDVLDNFSAGAGMSLDIFGEDGFFNGARIDYAYGNYGSLGTAHRIGFQVVW
ncbi:MAG: hypothetical protein J5706_09110 [Elusimicrobiales bacterium]|nr:hypothetical protein [Elusimicrobiales bacterium]